jgi:hypothetical protein
MLQTMAVIHKVAGLYFYPRLYQPGQTQKSRPNELRKALITLFKFGCKPISLALLHAGDFSRQRSRLAGRNRLQ